MEKTKNQSYKENNYDRMAIWVKKGRRENYKQSAAELGLSLATLVQKGVEEFIANHAGEEFPPRRLPESPPEKFTPEQRRLVEEFNQLPAETQKALVKLMRTINESKGGGGNGDD